MVETEQRHLKDAPHVSSFGESHRRSSGGGALTESRQSGEPRPIRAPRQVRCPLARD
jgi:hypothetical protein